ncbi:anti-sigma regulatory factor [Sedimentibacter sp. zth1]|uniref:ATP-binding protein n=1 Tax=Sedimentibacter sp. zth1 TaxID=2816908 RepID=UPI001A913C84|nr:ATP-binding protein [Sedimentibacter sp. zth1]QSX06198.1 anti-sigma regulatory factor [Sedimentibacter sp. zth1]
MDKENFLKRYSCDVVANNFSNAGKGSSDIKKNLKLLNIDPAIIRRIAIVSYEAEINLVIHSLGGKLHCDIYEHKIIIISEDIGPGIPNVELAMTEGYSTASSSVREFGFGAGMGLPNMKKWSDDFNITTKKTGTEISMTINI